MGYEFVPYVVFVLKIQIESTLRDPCLFHDIGNGGGVDALCDEEVVCAVKESFFFLFLILVNFPHYNRLSFLSQSKVDGLRIYYNQKISGFSSIFN